jgi:[ribosomal protein S18]-alanine N-acetyltransferase
VTVELRNLRQDDLPEVLAIEREAFPSSAWNASDFLRYDCVVAIVDGNLAGYLVSRLCVPASAEYSAERDIINLAVSQRYRRLRIASALLNRELSQPAAHYLEVRKSNTAARELYLRAGFAEIGRRSGYYSFPVEDAIVMSRKPC